MPLNAGASIPTRQPSEAQLRSELKARTSGSFDFLLQEWQQEYGSRAVMPLLKIALNSRYSDPDRYVALMGVAKLGGPDTAPLVARFLKDPSWMLRTGALKALAILKNDRTRELILPLLNDKALVVRLQAVEAVEKLNPPGAAQALVLATRDANNYHGGKSQWVPERALVALANLKAKDSAPQLAPLLNHSGDPDLQKATIHALEALTGRHVAQNLPLSSQVSAWKGELRRK